VTLCGIDEAGRGPLAGPVTAAAVILPPDFPREGLADSKALAPELRSETSERIRGGVVPWGLGWAWPAEIDQLNIHHASLLAMRRAFYAMLDWRDPPETEAGAAAPEHAADADHVPNASWGVSVRFGVTTVARGGPVPKAAPDRALVDGRHTPELPISCEAIVKGDATVAEIQAASIVAKVARDSWMAAYAESEPHYGFERHKGYPTPEHRRLLQQHGPSRIHRYSFRSGGAR
jgi:ribonuclease HII